MWFFDGRTYHASHTSHASPCPSFGWVWGSALIRGLLSPGPGAPEILPRSSGNRFRNAFESVLIDDWFQEQKMHDPLQYQWLGIRRKRSEKWQKGKCEQRKKAEHDEWTYECENLHRFCGMSSKSWTRCLCLQGGIITSWCPEGCGFLDSTQTGRKLDIPKSDRPKLFHVDFLLGRQSWSPHPLVFGFSIFFNWILPCLSGRSTRRRRWRRTFPMWWLRRAIKRWKSRREETTRWV